MGASSPHRTRAVWGIQLRRAQQAARCWGGPSWCSPRWLAHGVQEKGERQVTPFAHFEGSPPPAAPPGPSGWAGDSPGSGFPPQAGRGQGSMHLKFLLAPKLQTAVRGGGSGCVGSTASTPGRTACLSPCLCVCTHRGGVCAQGSHVCVRAGVSVQHGAYACACGFVCVHSLGGSMCVCRCMSAHLHVCGCVHLHVLVYMYECMHVHVCAHMCKQGYVHAVCVCLSTWRSVCLCL